MPTREGAEFRGPLRGAPWLREHRPAMPASRHLSKQQVGNAGLYYVCYRLTLLGWNVLPTSRNARGVDIVIYNHDASVKKAVQVKALSKRSPVPLGEHLDHLFADSVVVVRCVAEEPECFLLTPDDVRAGVHRGEKDGKVSCWLEPQAYEGDEYRERWDKIGGGA